MIVIRRNSWRRSEHTDVTASCLYFTYLPHRAKLQVLPKACLFYENASLDSRIVYEGQSVSHLVTGLRADSQYSFRLQLSTEGDDSPLSDIATATTEESPPDAPQGLRILAVTTSQFKLGWAPPAFNNGALKGYVVYNGKHQVETTTELSSIVSGLAPGTTYDLHVSIKR